MPLPLRPASLLLAACCALPAAAADTLTLSYTAKLRWGGQSGPAVSAVLNDVPVTPGADGFFDVAGTITLGLTAPPVVGFGPASGYWSEEALQRFTLTLGGRTFEWLNLPGSLDNRWGISLSGNATSGLVSTANAALPYYGGISPAISATAAGNGLLSVTQANAGGTRDLALGSTLFWWSGPGLVDSNQLAGQSFSGLGALSFGDPNGSGGAAVASRLFVQFLALPGGSTEPWQHVNAQNADGYFTSVTATVPEPGAAALLAAGLGVLAVRARRTGGRRERH